MKNKHKIIAANWKMNGSEELIEEFSKFAPAKHNDIIICPPFTLLDSAKTLLPSFIKIGAQIGAFNTVLLIFLTAIIGIYYAKYEGLNTIRSGFLQIIKNQTSKHRYSEYVEFKQAIRSCKRSYNLKYCLQRRQHR